MIPLKYIILAKDQSGHSYIFFIYAYSNIYPSRKFWWPPSSLYPQAWNFITDITILRAHTVIRVSRNWADALVTYLYYFPILYCLLYTSCFLKVPISPKCKHTCNTSEFTAIIKEWKNLATVFVGKEEIIFFFFSFFSIWKFFFLLGNSFVLEYWVNSFFL